MMDLKNLKLSEIYEGWRNKLVPPEAIKDIIKEVSQARMSICEECQFHSKRHNSIRLDDHCVQCGCTLSAKTACLSCKCPLPYPLWEPLEINVTDTKN